MRTLRAGLVLFGGFLLVGFTGEAIGGDNGFSWQFRSSRGLLFVITALAIVVGWTAAKRRRRPSIGPLLLVCSYVALAGSVSHDAESFADVACWLAGLGVPALIVLGHPNGMRGRERRLALAVLGGLAVLGIAAVATAGGVSPALIARNPGVIPTPKPDTFGRALFGVHTVVVALAALAFVVYCIQRVERRMATDRALVNPVLVGGIVWATSVAGAQILQLALRNTLDSKGRITDGTWTAIGNAPSIGVLALFCTVAYVELVRPVLGRTRAGAVMIRGDSVGAVRSHLGRWLQDPSVRLAFANPDGAWVDADGRPFVTDRAVDRTTTTLTLNGAPIALLEHRADLVDLPGIVDVGVTTVALAVEADRQVALARSHVADARRLGARLLLADEGARRELGDQLQSGPADELRRLATEVEGGADLAKTARRLRQVTAKVREISHGILPPELEGGLRPALPRAEVVPDRRFDTAIEVTAYLLARDDEHARIEDHGTELRLSLSHPPADADVRDRVDALGGAIDGAAVSLPLQV